MKPGPLVRSITVIGAAAFFVVRAASAADVQVMCHRKPSDHDARSLDGRFAGDDSGTIDTRRER